MIPPKCKACGETHWSPICPKFSKLDPKEKAARAKALGESHAAEKAAAPKKPRKAKKAKRKPKRKSADA